MKELEDNLEGNKKQLASGLAKHLFIPGYSTVKATEYGRYIGINNDPLFALIVALGVFWDSGKVAGYIYLGKIIYDELI